MMIKWCIYLRHQSNKAYETLRESGCIYLPSQCTLRYYTNCVRAGSGFSSEVDSLLMNTAKVTTSHDWQKLVVLLLDEMHIKEDLVYNKHTGIAVHWQSCHNVIMKSSLHTGQMIGFTSLGELNNHLMKFERMVEGEGDSNILAKSMMVFMVRGLFTLLRFPYVQFPCNKLTGALLHGPFWKAVFRLERL